MKKFFGACCLVLFVAASSISLVGCGATSAGDAKANMDDVKEASAEAKDEGCRRRNGRSASQVRA